MSPISVTKIVIRRSMKPYLECKYILISLQAVDCNQLIVLNAISWTECDDCTKVKPKSDCIFYQHAENYSYQCIAWSLQNLQEVTWLYTRDDHR